jgi:hypothetical protein
MPEIKYLCWFDEWSGFMDGQLIIGNLRINYDFVSPDTPEVEDDNPIFLWPFTEDAARKHFADYGINNIKFIYDDKDI